MDPTSILRVFQQFGGGLAVIALLGAGVFYVVYGLRRDGADLGIKSLQAALTQNTTDLTNVRKELENVRTELTGVKTELQSVRKEMIDSRKEVAALRRYAQALRAMIKREIPNANLPPAPDGIDL